VLVSRAANSPSSMRPLGPYRSSTAKTMAGGWGRNDQDLVEVAGTLSTWCFTAQTTASCQLLGAASDLINSKDATYRS